MVKQFIKRVSSVSFPVVIVGALLLVVAASAIAVLLMRDGSKASDNAIQPFAARVDRVDGDVGIARVENEDTQLDWTEATINTPVSVGDRIYARDDSHASIALAARDYVRLNPLTSLDVLSLEEQRTQLALRDGSAMFDVGELDSGELYEVATPYGAVDFLEPGLYQVGIDGNNAIISVLSGLAQVVGSEGSGYINKGEVLTLVGALAAEALSSKLAPNLAGNMVDDYYGYRYPDVYDGRYQNYDSYLSDPDYYDPHQTSVSYQYLDADIPGLYDLDHHGDWVDLNDYGRCWAPRVDSGWAPFRSGHWDLDDLWGPSWVSSEPWGWAPYHYGRWTHVSNRWFWVPGSVRARHEYSPAPVAFIPVAEQIAWVPLAPGEVYVPRYYDVNFTPRYLASPEVVNVVTVQKTFVNFNSPGAVTAVPFRSFNRTIDPRVLATVDPRLIERSRHVIDPFSVSDIRQLALSRRDARRRLKFERGEQLAFNRAVITSSTPQVVRVRSDLANSLRVEALPENRKRNKLKINSLPEVTSLRRDGLPQQPVVSEQRQQRISELSSRVNQGDKSARREMRQLMREQQRAGQQQPQAAQQQQPLDQKSRQELRQQRKAERQQQPPAAVQQEAARQSERQQMRQQRKAQRQQQPQAAAQQEAVRQNQQQQVKQQRQAQRQQSQAAAQQQTARQAQQQQMRQQRKLQRQQQPVVRPPQGQLQQQTRQERKEQKRLQRRPPQAVVNQPPQQMRQFERVRVQQAQQQAARQAQMAQQQQQLKAYQRAERQRSMIQQQQQQQQQNGRQAAMQAAQQAQANQARENARAQKRAQRQQQMTVQQAAPPRAITPQAGGSQRVVGVPGAVRQDSRAQRKAEKAQRRQSP